MSTFSLYHAGLMLRGAVMECDKPTARAIVKAMRKVTYHVNGGIIGTSDAARNLPHRTVTELCETYTLDVTRYVTPSMCPNCKKIIGLDVYDTLKNGKKRATLAVCHTIPRCRGGATNSGNLALGCAKCNSDVKDNMTTATVIELKKFSIEVDD